MIRSRSRCAPPGRRLHLETLEDRRLLSASMIELPKVAVEASHASDHILVRFLDAGKPVVLAGTTLGQALPLVANFYEIGLNAGVTVDQALAAYRKDVRVDYAETDANLGVASAPAAVTPNDPQFNQQWNLKNTAQFGGTAGADINATAAWGITTNASAIPIAVFDTGIDYTHPDLYDNIWINQKEIPASRLKNLVDVYHDGYISMRDLNNPINQGVGKITHLDGKSYIDGADLIAPMIKNALGQDTGLGGWADGISEDGDLQHIDDLIGWNFANNTNNPMDGFGHGTHVAGTLAAMGNNGTGVAGVAWTAQLVPVKFFDDNGNGTISSFITALQWALSKGIKISNNSWTDTGYTPGLYDAIKVAQGKGHLFIVAAGNGGRNTDLQPAYPADFALGAPATATTAAKPPLDNIVSVGATDYSGNLAGFSNYGVKSVAIAAPGLNILSTLPVSQGSYGWKSGTSMAAPQVTAVAALIWSLRPEWTYQQVINQLLSSARRLPSLTGKVASGLLDAYAALEVPRHRAPPPPLASAASPTKAGPSVGTPRAASFETTPSAAPQAASSPLTTAAPAQSMLAPFVWGMPISAPVASNSKASPPDVSHDNGLSLGFAADLFGSLLAPPPGVAPLHRAKPAEGEA
jgi:serine protease